MAYIVLDNLNIGDIVTVTNVADIADGEYEVTNLNFTGYGTPASEPGGISVEPSPENQQKTSVDLQRLNNALELGYFTFYNLNTWLNHNFEAGFYEDSGSYAYYGYYDGLDFNFYDDNDIPHDPQPSLWSITWSNGLSGIGPGFNANIPSVFENNQPAVPTFGLPAETVTLITSRFGTVANYLRLRNQGQV